MQRSKASTFRGPDLERRSTVLKESRRGQRSFVFVFGLPRSGTTWVGKIFDSHPDTLYKHEPDTFAEPDLPWAPDISEVELLRSRLDEWLRSIPDVNVSSVAGSLPVFPKSYRSWWQHSAHSLNVWSAIAGRKLLAERRILQFANNTDDALVIWKSINSLGRLGVLLRAAESRKAIVLIRHPCAVIASLKRGRALGYLHNDQSADYRVFALLLNTRPGKRHAITMDQLQLMRPEERLAWKWVLVYEKVLEDIAGIEDDVLILQYEGVCSDPENCTRRMFQLSGLTWNRQTEAFIKRSTAKQAGLPGWALARSGYFSVFQDSTRSASKWRDELTPDEIERVLAIVKRSHLRCFYL